MSDEKVVTAESLHEAWRKYTRLLGEDPHGTVPQLNALLEFIHNRDTVTISLNEAVTLNNVFLPTNPNKMRSATQEVRSVAIAFKALVSQKLQLKTAHKDDSQHKKD